VLLGLLRLLEPVILLPQREPFRRVVVLVVLVVLGIVVARAPVAAVLDLIRVGVA
jgi:hypothetical protein